MSSLVLLVLTLTAGFEYARGDATEVCFKPSYKRKIPDLFFDEAYLVVEDNVPSRELTLNGISTNCYNCALQLCGVTNQMTGNLSMKVSSRFAFNYELIDNSNGLQLCNGTHHFGEHGHYHLSIDVQNACSIKSTKQPIFTYLPLIILFAVIFFLVISTIIFNCLWRTYQAKKYGSYAPIPENYESPEQSETMSQNSQQSYQSMSSYYSRIPKHQPRLQQHTNRTVVGVTVSGRSKISKRVKSLDTFRGISIVIMIFVNYGGGKYWFFNHSKWNGLTLADLVFPWFIFIMGSSIFISCRSMRRKSFPKRTITKKIIIRTIKLFAIGLFLNNGSDYDHWRIPGVLQRFAGSYFVVAILNVWLSPEEDKVDIHYNYDWRDTVRDLTWFPLQHLAMLALLIIYLCITFLLNVPGCPKGYLGPGGISIEPKYENCTGGAAAYIDQKIFGANHIYGHPTCKSPYQCSLHDPEGLLGVIPSILLTYLGLMASRILFMYSRPWSHIKRWMFWCIVLGLIALGLCGASRDEGTIPINKNLWSLSFICATASMAYFLLTICYVTIDVKRLWSGAPFCFAGMNAILLYCGHEILQDFFPFNFNNNNQHSELLTRSAVGTFIWMIVAYACFRTNTFLKL